MSNVTSLILIFSSLENENERIKEVNAFVKKNSSLTINLKPLMDSYNTKNDVTWYGGDKYMLGNIYMGSYRTLDLNSFIDHLNQNVKWEERNLVQLFVMDENTNDMKYRLIELD